LRNASRDPGGVSTASPAAPVRTPCRKSRDSFPDSRQSASPASPVSGRSSLATKRQSASTPAACGPASGAWSIASSVSG
jgi:hypothetical protein